MRRRSVPNLVERGTFLRGFLISNHRVGVHGGVQDVKSSLRKAIPVIWALVVALGVLSPASTALGALAQDNSTSTTAVTASVDVNVSIVMIRSLNISIQTAINKLMTLNISRNSTEWQLVIEANQSLKLAIQANMTGNYTAAVKYAQEGLTKVRKALELLTQEYRVKANESVIEAIRYEGKVRALNRTAHVLLNATVRAEEKGTINVTVAEELKATLQNDIKALSELAEYLAKVVNGTETLNTTYVTTTLEKVAKNLANVRETLNDCAAKRLQEMVRARIMEQLKAMRDEVERIMQAAQEAQEQNLTVMAQELMRIAQNLTQKLMRIEKEVMGTTTPVNVTEVEKLLNITNQVKVLVSISHEVKCCSKHAVDLGSVMNDLARLRAAIMQVNMTYMELKFMTKGMGGNIADEVTSMGKLMKALQGNYSELEKALVEGDPSKVKECLNAINATVAQLSSMTNKMMQEKMSGPSANQVRTTLRKMDSELKAIMEQVRERLHLMESIAKQAQTSKSAALEAELRMAEKQLEKVMTLGKTSKVLTSTQVNRIREIQVSLSKAITLLKNGDTAGALKIIKTSIEVLKEIQHEVSAKAGKDSVIISTEIEVTIEVLHTVQSMIEH